MKVPTSVRHLHENQALVSARLKKQVDETIGALKRARWHYESRVKELASFALKVETGRFPNPEALEDFFACTLVVANATEIAEAEALVAPKFTIKYRRPKQHDHTHKTADSFPFDDLRLYVTLTEDAALPPSDLADVVFELQVKTFLQHAWSIATHDLLYKTDDVNWSKQRIAFQIKAMLEHAEISIQEAEKLAQSTSLAKQDHRTANIKHGIALLKRHWTPDELPPDTRRLAENITELLEHLHLEITALERILEDGKTKRNGAHPINLSPFGTVVQYLLEAEQGRMVKMLTNDHPKAKRLLLPAEITIPAGIDHAKLRNAIFVGTAAE